MDARRRRSACEYAIELAGPPATLLASSRTLCESCDKRSCEKVELAYDDAPRFTPLGYALPLWLKVGRPDEYVAWERTDWASEGMCPIASCVRKKSESKRDGTPLLPRAAGRVRQSDAGGQVREDETNGPRCRSTRLERCARSDPNLRCG